MDVLTDVLRTVRMRNVFHGRLELSAPWGASVDEIRHPFFYVVSRGFGWFEIEGERRSHRCEAGDLLLLTRGQAHVARDSPRTRAMPLAQIQSTHPRTEAGVLRYGGGGSATTMVCGHFVLEDQGQNPLISSLPDVVHLKGEDGETVQWFHSTLRFIASEAKTARPGSEMILGSLADILFVQMARAHLARADEGASGWLRALVDPHIGPALSLIHQQPGAPWTVESLASRAMMSRSSFAARFSELVGEPPHQYLTRWRMQKAAALLREGKARLAEIADRVGYRGEASLSRSFKRWTGVAPGRYRSAFVTEKGAAATAPMERRSRSRPSQTRPTLGRRQDAS